MKTRLVEDIVCARYDLEFLMYVIEDALETFHCGYVPDEYQIKDLVYAWDFLSAKLGSYRLLNFLTDEQIAEAKKRKLHAEVAAINNIITPKNERS